MNKWARPFEWNSASAEPAGGRAVHPAQLYFAFLSYSHQDGATADWLHGELERFRVPSGLVGRLTANGPIPKRLTPIFRDRHEFAAAADLGEEIREALAASRCLIVLCSPAAAKSKWTNAEIELFKRLHPDGCVIAAIVGGEPFASETPGREQEECLPPALRQKYDKRGRPTGRRAEPLAADLRGSQKDRRLGFLQIVAGMLGLGLDDLVQREQLRRQRRLAGITAGSFIGMLVAGGLAVTAIQARDAARDQRREAEGLVEFMLGDLKDKLEPIGRLDALDGVGARVLEYYAKQGTADLSDGALMQRSRALSLMGEVATLRGDLNTALLLYGEAMDGTAEAARRDPNDPQRLFDHAQNVFWVGEIPRQRGQLRTAERAMREYERLAARMVALDPDNMRWRMEAQYADANLGIIFFEQRRFGDATRQFAESLQTIEALSKADSDNVEYQKSFAESLAWLADAEAAEGRIDNALEHRRRQVTLLRQMLAKSRGDVEFQQALIPAYQALGNLFAAREEIKAALRQLGAAVQQADLLIPREPSNSLWLSFAGQARLDFAENLLVAGQRLEAEAQTTAACRTFDALLRRNRSIGRWRAGRRDCLRMQAMLASDAGNHTAALGLAGRALAAALAVNSGDPIGDRYSAAGIRRLTGDIRQAMGDGRGAQAEWRAGLESLPRNARDKPAEMAERAALLRRLNMTAELQPVAERLSNIGYRRIA